VTPILRSQQTLHRRRTCRCQGLLRRTIRRVDAHRMNPKCLDLDLTAAADVILREEPDEEEDEEENDGGGEDDDGDEGYSE
jgi:hypothetical protein